MTLTDTGSLLHLEDLDSSAFRKEHIESHELQREHVETPEIKREQVETTEKLQQKSGMSTASITYPTLERELDLDLPSLTQQQLKAEGY